MEASFTILNTKEKSHKRKKDHFLTTSLEIILQDIFSETGNFSKSVSAGRIRVDLCLNLTGVAKIQENKVTATSAVLQLIEISNLHFILTPMKTFLYVVMMLLLVLQGT